MIYRVNFGDGVSVDMSRDINPQMAKYVQDKAETRMGVLLPRIYQLTLKIPQPNFNFWLTVHQDGTGTLKYELIRESGLLFVSSLGEVIVIDRDQAEGLPERYELSEEREISVLVNAENTMIPFIGRVAPYEFCLFDIIQWVRDDTLSEADKKKWVFSS